MNLATLEVSPIEARQALVHYRRSLKERSNAEYDAICKGYQRVLKGQRLIELSKVIAAGGVDSKHRPRLAVMRADQKMCYVQVSWNGSLSFSNSILHCYRVSTTHLTFRAGTVPPLPNRPNRGWASAVAAKSVIPLVPPQYRPKGNLSRYHILWEATWEDVPVDPALIQHLGGDLWAVLAVWDLTPLERAVLAGRQR